MFKGSDIFEKHYKNYCDQIGKIEFASIKDKLGVEVKDDRMLIPLFNRDYRISGDGIADVSGNIPDYRVCVILAKYILLCPDQLHHNTEWGSFREFKRESHFTNVNFFASDTEQAILKQFSGNLDGLFKAGKELGGFKTEDDMPYDLSMQFDALPRISLLLLFNDRDEEFPAQCSVLFQKHSEFYLDPESLAITSAVLANRLRQISQHILQLYLQI